MFSGMNVKRKTTSSIFLMMPHVCLSVCVCVVLSEKHVHGNIAIRALLQNLIWTQCAWPADQRHHVGYLHILVVPTFSCNIPLLFPSLGFKYALQKFNGVFFLWTSIYVFAESLHVVPVLRRCPTPFLQAHFLSRELLRETQYIDDYTDSSIYIFWTYCIWSIHPNCAAHPQNKYTWIRVDDDSSPTWWENGSW